MHSTEPTSSDGRHRAQRLHRFVFLVLEGARLEAGGSRVSLTDVDELVIGRGDARVLRKDGRKRALEIPDGRMSGAHARLVEKDGAIVLHDAGSTNGTIVNGHVVTSSPLKDGDVFELGQTVFLYRELVDEGPAAGDLDASDKRIKGATMGLATLDPNLARRYDRLARVAAAPLAILLLGDTGTGKEVLARAVHTLSKRPGSFVAVNCGAIPHGLVESHLFGHVRGSFSGAVRDEPGLVRAANFGTLLLDEIGDLPASSQAALLRVLQEGEVLPVGATQPAKVDVRVIGATHKSLDDLVERGEFRRDLYARLAGYVFQLSPVRDRKMDLGLLLASLLGSGKIPAPSGLRLHREAARALLRYDWPMNVRELEQCLRASTVLTDRDVIHVDDLPATVAGALAEDDDATDEPTGRDEELRRELLVRMADARGNVSEVARAMGKARQQVQRWVRRFNIDPDAFRGR